jgi:hypothetical protein
VIEQNAANFYRRHGEEMGTILPVDRLSLKFDVELSNQRRRLQRVAQRLAPHLTGGNRVQILIDRFQQIRFGLPVPGSHAVQ